MKIIHVCFEAPYIDNWGYQENLIPKYNKKMGNDVIVIASRNVLPKYVLNKNEYLNKPKEYIIDGVKIIRLKSSINIFNRIVWYRELNKVINIEKPDLIYLHSGQSFSLLNLVKYKKKNKCKIIVDFHSDYKNSGLGLISKMLLHKVIWKKIITYSKKYVDTFYCITPWVKKFVVEMYNIEESQIDMIYLSADDDKVDFNNKEAIRRKIRGNLNIETEDKVIITGGKINKDKNIDKLIKAVTEINNIKIKVIIFGSVEKKYTNEFELVLNSTDKIKYIGWINAEEIYNYYLASDIAVFPGTQSALWQQAIYCGLPLIVKRWPMSDYLNDGNVLFLESDNVYEIIDKINYIMNDENKLSEMSQISIKVGQEKFSYKFIAEKFLK